MVQSRKTVDGDSELQSSKEFAPPYKEEKEPIGVDGLSKSSFEYNTYDITYKARTKTKTVRSHGGTGPASYNKVPEDFMSFYDDGQKYAYNIDDRILMRLNTNGQNATVATGDDIRKIERVSYGDSAVVKGAVSDDVIATIYYRSPRSDEMQTVDVNVEFLEGSASASNISGEAVNSDKRIEAMTQWERDIISKTGVNEMTLGKVCRVEFPRGQKFTVDVHGLDGDNIDRKLSDMERKINSAFRNTEIENIDITHEGELKWD